MKRFLRLFFRLLYHQLAFVYDLVAASVSFNRWKDWVMSVIPFIEGNRILEIGHGPGHLQRVLLGRQWVAVGIDESAQMGYLAKRNTDGSARLTRGLAQHLPFPNETFDTIVSTFPADYINDARTLAEVKRCLLNGGRFILLPVAWPKNPFLDWLFRVTGESPSEAMELVMSKFKEPLVQAGFETEVRMLDVKSSLLLIVVAKKTIALNHAQAALYAPSPSLTKHPVDSGLVRKRMRFVYAAQKSFSSAQRECKG